MKNVLIGKEVYRVTEKEFTDFCYYNNKSVFKYDIDRLIESIKNKRKLITTVDASREYLL